MSKLLTRVAYGYTEYDKVGLLAGIASERLRHDDNVYVIIPNERYKCIMNQRTVEGMRDVLKSMSWKELNMFFDMEMVKRDKVIFEYELMETISNIERNLSTLEEDRAKTEEQLGKYFG